MTPVNQNFLIVFNHDYLPTLICFPDKRTPPLYFTYDEITNLIKLGNDYYLYTDSFLSIITESRRITNYVCISEKTLKPMLMKKSFILIAGPYALHYLRELGFKTFSDFWDESCDMIKNSKERFQSLLKTIDQVLVRPLDVLKKILVEMENILLHNHVHASFGLPQYFKNRLESIISPEQTSPQSNWKTKFMELFT